MQIHHVRNGGVEFAHAVLLAFVVAFKIEADGFEDAAAILNLVDVLVSIDSSPVHLAGALGRPAWVMLPFVPDWRWLLARDDSPWYPSVRLFRQPKPDDWVSVTGAIAAEIAQLKLRRMVRA